MYVFFGEGGRERERGGGERLIGRYKYKGVGVMFVAIFFVLGFKSLYYLGVIARYFCGTESCLPTGCRAIVPNLLNYLFSNELLFNLILSC